MSVPKSSVVLVMRLVGGNLEEVDTGHGDVNICCAKASVHSVDASLGVASDSGLPSVLLWTHPICSLVHGHLVLDHLVFGHAGAKDQWRS